MIDGYCCITRKDTIYMTEKYYGNLQPSDDASAYNELIFQINSILKRINTSMPVQVTAVKAGGLGPVGFVDVQVMVTQLTGNNTVVSNPSISNVPYFRLQGGTNAVILDPQAGDIGIACFCQRDISSVKAIRAIAPPGSHRTFSFSDAVYVGGILNGTPEQYIKFDGSGIVVYSPTKITCVAPDIEITADNSITLTAQNVTVNALSQMSVQSPMLSASADVMADGNILDQGGQKSMAGMRSTYNSHTHDETQSVTKTPNEQM